MPRGLEMRSTGEQHQDGSRWGLVQAESNAFQRRWVSPMQVFHDEEYRLMCGKFEEDSDDGFEGLLALTLWGQIERRIAVFRQSKGQKRCQQGYGFLDGKSILAQCVFQFLQFRVSGLMGFKPQYPLEQLNQRKQCCILRVLCTPTFPAYMWLVGNVVFQHLHQAGLAN